MQYKARVSKILFTDVLSLGLLLAVISAAGLLAAGLLLPGILIAGFAGAALLGRVSRIRSIVEAGLLVDGILASKQTSRGAWVLIFVFRGADDRMHRAQNIVVGRAIPMDEGDTILIAYDPANPQTAFPPDLYAVPE